MPVQLLPKQEILTAVSDIIEQEEYRKTKSKAPHIQKKIKRALDFWGSIKYYIEQNEKK
jgi:hypothetical protein